LIFSLIKTILIIQLAFYEKEFNIFSAFTDKIKVLILEKI